jgi:hypothetical protein
MPAWVCTRQSPSPKAHGSSNTRDGVPNHVINALQTKSALARYANDARGFVRVKGMLNNADYVVDGLKAYIESKKDIPAGEEIFVDYGKDYWKVIRENMRLWKAEEKEAKAAKKKTKAGKGR